MRNRSRLLRFGVVGVVNTAIDLGLYLVLRAAGLPLFPANLCSTSAGLLFSFVANRSFTFGDRVTVRRGRVAALFFLTTGLGLWVLQPLVIAGTERLVGAWGLGGETAAFPVETIVPKLIGIAAGIVWNYLAYDRIVFTGDRRERPPAGKSPGYSSASVSSDRIPAPTSRE